MDVRLDDRQQRLPPASRILKAIARRVVRAEGTACDEVGVVIADDDLLRELNARYRGKPRPTDVLAFPGETRALHRHLGEVIISSERALSQARRGGHGVAEEMARLLVHGLLHLLGYEHASSGGRLRMRAAENAHLESLSPWIRKLDRLYASASPG